MSTSGYVIPVDPNELASRFPAAFDPRFDDDEEDYLDDDGEDTPDAQFADYYEWASGDDFQSRIEPLLDRIPEREADLIHLYFIQKKRQADIATIFGVTQAAVSYRLDRGLQRIRFLLSIPQVTEAEIRRDLPDVFPQQIDVDILAGMWETTCQSEVATKLGLTQGRVRHRFFKAVKTLEKAAEADERFDPYRAIFSAIAGKKFNILREVKLPQWADRGGDECF
jgi:DNA-directed RNA polymerase specialized sigma24 family protein